MLGGLIGNRNERQLRRWRGVVESVNALEARCQAWSDQALREQTGVLRARLAQGESLDSLLAEAFAAVREAARRGIGLRHYDVQMIGGAALHEGGIAEMGTGEGKTLVATLPLYLNALAGSAHLVTVNDYLAARDAAWMRPVYEALDMSVGVVLSGLQREDRSAAYAANITYGTNNEFGFDYLRDNMVYDLDDKVQGVLRYAIVDEVDSILIDEARTPLIISGASEATPEMYQRIDRLALAMREVDEQDEDGHYVVDEAQRQVEVTEQGHQHVERWLTQNKLLKEGESLYSGRNLRLLQHVQAALRAHALFQNGVEYIVEDGNVVLIDEHTGRTMPGRRLSEGLHQAIEAKEGLAVRSENQTLASTTFQNYFRLYDKLAGMTGTAATEAQEFHLIYGLDVVVAPPNKPNRREDYDDLIFVTKDEKLEVVVEDIKSCLENGAPVLVGTASVEASEETSRLLRKHQIVHKVLNAKYHRQEAEIIAEAGVPGTVTIATNMAGRGTDIVLGGNLEAQLKGIEDHAEIEAVKARWKERHDQALNSGGLHILSTERHESRRIDNQLRGRAGRQGDPGVTRFYLSLEDDLMRRFASAKVQEFMRTLGVREGEAIEHRMVTRAIERAQRKVEARNFDIRKQLLEYDNVVSEQRRVIYQQRTDLLRGGGDDPVGALCADVMNAALDVFLSPASTSDQWDIEGLERHLRNHFLLDAPVGEWLAADDSLSEAALRGHLIDALADKHQSLRALVGPENMDALERRLMLQVLDNHWTEHLTHMEHLRQGIHLRAYAQRNPKQEYKRESFQLFGDMLDNIKTDVVRLVCSLRVSEDNALASADSEPARRAPAGMALRPDAVESRGGPMPDEPAALAPKPLAAQASASPPRLAQAAQGKKLGRNAPCHCGSGKKYKHCHGLHERNDAQRLQRQRPGP